MRIKIFILKCKILKHKLTSILFKLLKYLLAPFAIMTGIIIYIYGKLKGLTLEEMLEISYKFKQKILKIFS